MRREVVDWASLGGWGGVFVMAIHGADGTSSIYKSGGEICVRNYDFVHKAPDMIRAIVHAVVTSYSSVLGAHIVLKKIVRNVQSEEEASVIKAAIGDAVDMEERRRNAALKGKTPV